jgi:hypothetical protein
MGEAWRGRRGQRRDEAPLGQTPNPTAEEAGRKAAGGDDDPRPGRRLRELRLDDPRQGEIAERAVSVPALVSRLRDDPTRLGKRIQAGERGQPTDPGDPMPRAPAPVGLLEVVGQEASVALGETEGRDLLECGQAETSGSGLTMPTPCSRFAAAIVSASAMIARETSAAGSASTIGSPASA